MAQGSAQPGYGISTADLIIEAISDDEMGIPYNVQNAEACLLVAYTNDSQNNSRRAKRLPAFHNDCEDNSTSMDSDFEESSWTTSDFIRKTMPRKTEIIEIEEDLDDSESEAIRSTIYIEDESDISEAAMSDTEDSLEDDDVHEPDNTTDLLSECSSPSDVDIEHAMDLTLANEPISEACLGSISVEQSHKLSSVANSADSSHGNDSVGAMIDSGSLQSEPAEEVAETCFDSLKNDDVSITSPPETQSEVDLHQSTGLDERVSPSPATQVTAPLAIPPTNTFGSIAINELVHSADFFPIEKSPVIPKGRLSIASLLGAEKCISGDNSTSFTQNSMPAEQDDIKVC